MCRNLNGNTAEINEQWRKHALKILPRQSLAVEFVVLKQFR